LDQSDEVVKYLEHHGVMGQKWGIRNDKGSKGTTASTSTSKPTIKLDEKPWSAYSKADYTPEQWHNATLIHNHTGPPTSKAQCKLPIKTPNGVVNHHAVYSAAAALAGARGGVFATTEQKHAAANKLTHIYHQMNQKPPPSLVARHSVIGEDVVNEILDHHGVKGQKWGIRNDKPSVKPASGDSKRAQALKKKPVHTLTNEQLKTLNTRMNLEQNYSRMNPSAHAKGKKRAEEILATVGVAATAYNLFNSPAGKAAISAGKKFLSK